MIGGSACAGSTPTGGTSTAPASSRATATRGTTSACRPAACALLGPGPAELESWGDEPAVLAGYRQAGLVDIERVDGWELVLPASRPAAADLDA